MKILSTINRYIVKIWFALTIAGIFIFPFIVLAQGSASSSKTRKEPIIKTQPKKTSRIFYGQASFYANKFNGRRTANGEIFNQQKLTCACNVLPLGSWIKVTNLRNGRTVIVKTNDRIHPKIRRVVDLSKAAAQQLGFISRGITRVKVELIDKKNLP